LRLQCAQISAPLWSSTSALIVPLRRDVNGRMEGTSGSPKCHHVQLAGTGRQSPHAPSRHRALQPPGNHSDHYQRRCREAITGCSFGSTYTRKRRRRTRSAGADVIPLLFPPFFPKEKASAQPRPLACLILPRFYVRRPIPAVVARLPPHLSQLLPWMP